MSDDLSVLATPQARYALVDNAPWAMQLDRDGPALRAARVSWAHRGMVGSLSVRELLPDTDELPREAAFWDDLFDQLDAGLLRHPERVLDESADDGSRGSAALTALRALVRRLREDPSPARGATRCSHCRHWVHSFQRLSCEHADGLRRALRAKILDDVGLLFESLGLLRVVTPRYPPYTRRYVLAPVAELLAGRVGRASTAAVEEFRRARQPWRPRGAERDAGSIAVRFACDAWGLPADAVSPAPDASDAPPLALDLAATDDEPAEVTVMGLAPSEDG